MSGSPVSPASASSGVPTTVAGDPAGLNRSEQEAPDLGRVRLLVLVQGFSRGLQGVKLQALLEALRRRVPNMTVWDIDLSGVERLAYIMRTFHPSLGRWRDRYHAHPLVFDRRTEIFRRRRGDLDRFDAVLQIGVMYDADPGRADIPLTIYTDYSVSLALEHGRDYRMPLSETLSARRMAQERRALQAASVVCARSRLVAGDLISRNGIDLNRITVIGGGSNILPPAGERPLRAKGTGPRFLFVGADFRRKGGDRVLAAFALLKSRNPEAALVLVTRDAIRPNQPGVEVLTDISTQELARQYDMADALVLASRLETWGDVLIEAMHFGLVCIAPTGAPYDEIIEAGVTGHLVDVADPARLAEAMAQVAADPVRAAEMGRAAQERAARIFSWQVVADKLLQAISSTLAEPRPSRAASSDASSRP